MSNIKRKKSQLINEDTISENSISLTKQQRFNFDNNQYEDDYQKDNIKKRALFKSKYFDLKRKIVKLEKEKRKYKRYYHFTVFFSTFLMLITLFFIYIHIAYEPKYIEKKKIIQDENIVFLGDSLTYRYDLDKYYKGYKVVNSGVNGDKTIDILNNMKNRVYQYNPSKVILLIGANDIDYADDSIIDSTFYNIRKIANSIKKNRKYTDIYIQSIYPVNKILPNSPAEHKDNSSIEQLNLKIKKLCKDQGYIYINIYDKLRDKDNQLKYSYTIDGLHLNEDGYNYITKEIKKYVFNK